MSDEATRQFHNRVGPTQSTVPGIGVTRLATSVTAVAIDISGFPDLFNKVIRFSTEGTDPIWISFSSDGVGVLSKAATPGASVAAGTLVTNGVKITAGAPLDVRLSRTLQKYIHFQADASTPVLSIYPISPPRA